MINFERWYQEQAVLLSNLPSKKQRYLYEHINWHAGCVGIVGPRGTGKSTMIKQFLQQSTLDGLYVSVDSPNFSNVSLFDFATEFHMQGGELLVLDEVHKYPGWSKHIKAIIDARPGLKMIFSGSSLLQINKQDADLSRRTVIHRLNGMSFREFLNFFHNINLPSFSLKDIFEGHESIAGDIHKKLGKTLKYFRDYLKIGHYPFSLEDPTSFRMKLANTIKEVLEVDLGFICDIKYDNVHKVKRLLLMLANTPPYELNKKYLSNAIDISRPTVDAYLLYLREAGLINIIKPEGRGHKSVRKKEKLLINNTNIMHAITSTPDVGTLREVFFANQIQNYYSGKDLFLPESIECAAKGDYFVGDAFIEIGGKNKGFSQVKGVERAYVAADDIEVGYGKKVPLWLFGMMY